jgi:hypothetical protein
MVTRKEHGNAAYLREWRKLNPDKAKAQQEKYLKANKSKHQAAVRRANTRRREQRIEWLSAYKLQRGCTDCGYKAHAQALDFDHLPDFEKRFTISGGVTSRSMDDLVEEISRCEVVCANCHRVRTAARRK